MSWVEPDQGEWLVDYTAPVDLSGRVAIVTGASRGIGLAIADAFAQAGAAVCLTARKQDELDSARASITSDHVTTFAGSMGDRDAIEASVVATMEAFGRVDVIVNNAATNPAFGPLMDVQPSAWRKNFEVNVEGPLWLTQAAWRAWMHEHGGVVLNVTTSGMYGVAPFLGAYEASKTTLRYLTKQLAGELAPKVRVNSLSPGTVKTQMSRVLWESGEDAVAQSTPMGRIGAPADCGAAALFLCSDRASWVTGMDFVIDGGSMVGGAAVQHAPDGAGSQIIQNLRDAANAT
jgi:NAD(P)-dependent dehydrogenase (short-subunit alcohol dehydrogenase family)